MLKRKIYTTFLCIVSVAIGFSHVYAEEISTTELEDIPILPKITVSKAHIDNLTSAEVISRDVIDKLPSNNATVTELLKTVPGVQFSESLNDSRTGGEIKPPEISISGGRTVDNSYIFDGVNLNSLSDPDFSSVHNYDNLPGHSQRMFLLDHLVEDITVLRSNIPARYGNFTGGVVEIKSIDPEPEITGEISYRTTRSDWGQFYIDPDDEEEFRNSTDSYNQPNFEKHETSVTLHIPVNDEMRFLFDYSRLESKIPINEFDHKKNQRRRNENFFLKFVATPNAKTELRLAATYAPYQGDYNLSDTLNSDYELDGGGYILDAELNQQTTYGQFNFNVNYQESENSREASKDWYSWRATPSKDWGTTVSKEGGYGDLEKLEKSVEVNLDFTSNELAAGATKHTFSVGTELSYLQATFDRTEEATQYIAYLADDSDPRYPVIPCPADDEQCIDGEQFIYYKNTRPVNEADADIFNIQAYFEDQLAIDRLSLRPGLRVSYENYQKNLNLAPRFAVSFDVFDNNKTVISGGYNRYFGTNLLALDLRSQQAFNTKAYRCVDNGSNKCDTSAVPKYSPNYAWLPLANTSFSTSRVSNLDTPYSDELTLGIHQYLLGGQLELLYIDREYKDQIVSVILDRDENGYIYSEWRNDGRRSHEEVSLSWQRSWKKHYLFMAVTWEETESNSTSYTDYFSEHQLKEDPNELDLLVWYEGKLTDRRGVPINDYNRPYKANIIYSVNLPYNFAFTNVMNYRSRYHKVEEIRSGDVLMPDGSLVDVRTLENDYYDKTVKNSDLTFDWKFSWQTPDWGGNSAELTLDILNVFNRKVEIGTEDDSYKLGRQYWAGLTYKF